MKLKENSNELERTLWTRNLWHQSSVPTWKSTSETPHMEMFIICGYTHTSQERNIESGTDTHGYIGFGFFYVLPNHLKTIPEGLLCT